MHKLVIVTLLAGTGAFFAAFTDVAAAPRTHSGAAAHARPVPAIAGAPGPRIPVGAGISLRLPPGWQLVHGRLSDVVNPAARLAIASFPAKLSRHECECGMPNVVSFPRGGAFLFVWEYLDLPRRMLGRFPPRPARLALSSSVISGIVCGGPSDTFTFRQAGRPFQAEIYVGAGAGADVRSQLLSAFDSLRVAPS